MELTQQHKKYLMYSGIGLVLAGIIYYISKAANNGSTGANLDPTGNGSSTTPIPVGGVFNAKNIAETLYGAMKDMGTVEGDIMDALTHVSASQFEQVFKAFGKRSYNTITGNTYFMIWQTPTYYDLKFWLKSELSDTDYRILKLKYPIYL